MKLKKIGKVIPLNNNKGYVRVDREDYEYLKQFRWYLFQSEKWKYAIRGEFRNGVTKTIFMHREILKIKDSNVYVDHRDHDGLNNRKENLRVSDNRHNQYNVSKKKNSHQKYKNIRFLGNDTWQVRMRIPNGRRIERVAHSEEEAVKLYNDLALKYHGEYAVLQTLI